MATCVLPCRLVPLVLLLLSSGCCAGVSNQPASISCISVVVFGHSPQRLLLWVQLSFGHLLSCTLTLLHPLDSAGEQIGKAVQRFDYDWTAHHQVVHEEAGFSLKDQVDVDQFRLLAVWTEEDSTIAGKGFHVLHEVIGERWLPANG